MPQFTNLLSQIVSQTADIWMRIDISATECVPDAQWVVDSKKKNGGESSCSQSVLESLTFCLTCSGGGHGGAGNSLSSSMANLGGQLSGVPSGEDPLQMQALAKKMAGLQMKVTQLGA